MEHIRHSVTIAAPAEKVYEAITTQTGLANWWTRETIAQPQTDFINEFRFGDHPPKKMRVTSLQPNQSVAWHCEEAEEEWVNTNFSFNLETKEDKTVLRFTHTDWREATEYYEVCNYHWAYFLHSLKKLCETGTGHPFPDMD